MLERTRPYMAAAVMVSALLVAGRATNAPAQTGSSASSDKLSADLQLLDELRDESLISTAIHERRRRALLSLTSPESTDRQRKLVVDPYPAGLLETRRSASSEPSAPATGGRRIALIIGNIDYRHLPPLETALNDARAVALLLQGKFGFNVNLLENTERDQLLITLNDYRRGLQANDDFILYYAGHGHVDTDTERGYWLPIDARNDNPTDWISSVEISDMLLALPARNAMVIADSCFSASLLQDATDQTDNGGPNQRQRSRTVITSGGLEPVLDTGPGQHSLFAQALLAALRDHQPGDSVRELFLRVRDDVEGQIDQTPHYGVLTDAGHNGGEFPLVR